MASIAFGVIVVYERDGDTIEEEVFAMVVGFLVAVGLSGDSSWMEP